MQKALIFGAASVLLCSAGFVTVISAQEDQVPEHAVIIDGTNKSMNPAYFPHRDHQDRLKDCGICHHGMTADGKQESYKAGATKLQKCSICHNKNADGISLEGKADPVVGISPIQRAGHGRCKGCHQNEKSSKNPPVHLMDCPTCHTKK